MLFRLAEIMLSHPASGETPAHFHFHTWHVATIVLALLCVLLIAGVYVLDLRKTLKDRDRETARMRRELQSREWAANSLQGSLGVLARELAAMATELAALDPRLAAAAIVLAKRGRELDIALDIVRKVQDHNLQEAARLAGSRRLIEEADRRNLENAAALKNAGGALVERERAVARNAEQVRAAAQENARNAASLQESTVRNAGTIRQLESAVETAKEKGLVPSDDDTDEPLLN